MISGEGHRSGLVDRAASTGCPRVRFLEVEVDGSGSRMIAFDVLGSGVGEQRAGCAGVGCRGLVHRARRPVDALIIGSIDDNSSG